MLVNTREGGRGRTLMLLGGLGLGSVFISCAVVYFFVDPLPSAEDEAPPMSAYSSPDADEPDGGSSLQTIPGEGISMDLGGARGGATLRAPDVGKVRASSGGAARRRPSSHGGGRDQTKEAQDGAAPPARPKGGPLNRLSATLHRLVDSLTGGGSPGKGGEGGAFFASAGSGEGAGRLFSAAGASSRQQPGAKGSPGVAPQRAVGSNRSGLAFAPLGSFGGAGPGGPGAQSAPSQAYSPQAADAPAGGGGATYGAASPDVGTPVAATPAGGSWGSQSSQGGSIVPLTKIESYKGTVWGLDLATLYKKLKALGVPESQFRLLEDCLTGAQGCVGGDIWEACTKAMVFNACANICHGVPGCVVPGEGGTGTNTGTGCVPEPGCLEAGTMLEVVECETDAKVWTKSGGQGCCSCDSSCYTTPNSSPHYGNTGVNCHSSCPTGQYVHRFCSN